MGLFLGNLAGLLLLCGGYPSVRRLLETAFPYSAFGYYSGDLARLLGFVCGGLIFPAVLTYTAKRFYFWWGLLPLVLLMLWIVAGSVVSHTLTFLRDPPFVFPLAALMCWIISSAPIAVFRVWRNRRRLLAQASASTQAKRSGKLVGWTALTVPFVALILLGWHNFRHIANKHAHIETTWVSSSEAQVPLVVKHGGIFVMASLSGEPHLCKIDTGSDAVIWARSSHLTGTPTGECGQSSDAMNSVIDSDTVKVPYIQIGAYKITDLPTERLDIDSVLFSPPHPAPPDDYILLGNPAFDLTVLTIDYRNKLLIIRPASYDFQKAPRHQGDRTVQMGWTSHKDDTEAEQSVFGWPAVRASVDGKPFWCMLDTGWEGPELGLSEDFASQVPALQKLPRRAALFHSGFAASTASQIPALRFEVPCLSPVGAPPLMLKSAGMLVKSCAGGEGVVGTYLMERYRITIDYQRRRVLLEPYTRDVPGKKQEKQAAVTKPTTL